MLSIVVCGEDPQALQQATLHIVAMTARGRGRKRISLTK